jgi:hypothetical protein
VDEEEEKKDTNKAEAGLFCHAKTVITNRVTQLRKLGIVNYYNIKLNILS